ncbi:hypothetical protein WN51_10126 [Melipona quadrifasciata]|uniref:Uncharacterized protein n=1 Tax=Melipona quadrifasciata TaxID=166423 RepID=A0A0N0BBD9_9HYME|nr:hypothetical protein WN51_10126 [Melipona quadrifasciata]
MKRQEGLKRKVEEQKTHGPSDQQSSFSISKPSADSDDPLCKKEKPECESRIAESSLESPSTEFLSSTLDVVQREKRLSIPDLETPMPSTSAGSQSFHQRLEHLALPGGSGKGCNIVSDVPEIFSESRLHEYSMKKFLSDEESDGEEIEEAGPPLIIIL